MTSFARRGFAAFTLLVVLSIAGFAILRLMPGDFVAVLLTAQSDGVLPTPEAVAAYAATNGFDAPLPVQYLRWLGDVLGGDLGTSFTQARPVADLIKDAARNSALLTGSVMLTALLVAFPVAIIAALRPNSLIDRAVMLFSVAGMSVPTFWYALLLSLLFVLQLRWLPSSGFDSAVHIILPTLVAATGVAGFLARYLRSLLIEQCQRPHILTARAQGASQLGALIRHAIPNCAPALLTVIGAQMIHIFEGMLVIETIFNWPGMGRLFVNALMSRDFPVIQACFLVIGTAYVAINLAVDLAVGLADRRSGGAV